MSFSFLPDYVFQDYESITPELLKGLGIRLLLTDLDYTLAPKRVPEPDGALHAWIESLRRSGITVMILSNNRSSARVERFCGSLGISYVGHAGKPGTRGFREAMRNAGIPPEQTAMLGDKLLTDTLGAKRSGILMLMVEPRGGPWGLWNKVLYVLQEPFKLASPHDKRGAGGGTRKKP